MLSMHSQIQRTIEVIWRSDCSKKQHMICFLTTLMFSFSWLWATKNTSSNSWHSRQTRTSLFSDKVRTANQPQRFGCDGLCYSKRGVKQLSAFEEMTHAFLIRTVFTKDHNGFKIDPKRVWEEKMKTVYRGLSREEKQTVIQHLLLFNQ